RAARERARPLFAEFGLDGFEGVRPEELSGGMRQRAALLRTVVQDRPVLLLTHDVREAVLLADRVVVLAPRPTTVRRVVTVDLPRPRDLSVLTDPAFTAAEADLLAGLHAT